MHETQMVNAGDEKSEPETVDARSIMCEIIWLPGARGVMVR